MDDLLCPFWEFAIYTYLLNLQCLQGSPNHWQFSKARIGPLFACGFQNAVVYEFITKLCSQQAGVNHNHRNSNVRSVGQGE
jgi:hypothetical protein